MEKTKILYFRVAGLVLHLVNVRSVTMVSYCLHHETGSDTVDPRLINPLPLIGIIINRDPNIEALQRRGFIPYTLNSSFHVLFHYPYITRIA